MVASVSREGVHDAPVTPAVILNSAEATRGRRDQGLCKKGLANYLRTIH